MEIGEGEMEMREMEERGRGRKRHRAAGYLGYERRGNEEEFNSLEEKIGHTHSNYKC